MPDAACVATVASTFAGVTTVADLCAELQPSQPNNDGCDRADDELLALALNVCRARVCTLQGIDVAVRIERSVGQSLAQSNQRDPGEPIAHGGVVRPGEVSGRGDQHRPGARTEHVDPLT
jgi:hypothetical protein